VFQKLFFAISNRHIACFAYPPIASSEETFMAIFVSFVLSLFFISACAMLAEENEAPTPLVAVQVPASETENVSNSSEPTESSGEGDNQLTAARKDPTKEEIRLVQAQLKASGFDPGPVDGMFGVKTRSALNRLQSSCANLEDIMENSDAGIFQRQPVTQTARPNEPATKVSSKEAVRLLQVRLKDSGFDAGPIDGVLGVKTQSALLRLQSGCTLLKDLPWTLDSSFPIAERTASLASGSDKQNQMDISKSGSVAATRNASDRVVTADAKIPSKEEIQIVQGRLKDAGFDPGPIDGVLGLKTKSALQQYQTSYGTMNARKLLSGVALKLDY
jgi:peptidoglycan hydrolase-like protein with peptidoglycan-binding domain